MPNSVQDHRASGRWHPNMATGLASREHQRDSSPIDIATSSSRVNIHRELESARPAATRFGDRLQEMASGPTQLRAPLAALLLWSDLTAVQPPVRARMLRDAPMPAIVPEAISPRAMAGPVADAIIGAGEIQSLMSVAETAPPRTAIPATTPSDMKSARRAGIRQFTITDPAQQRKMLVELEAFFLKAGYLRPEQLEAFREQYAGIGSHTAITVYSVPPELEASASRARREAIGQAPPSIRDDALLNRGGHRQDALLPVNAQTCREGITHYQGGRGDFYIIAGNYIQDPFLDVLDNDGKAPTAWQKFWHTTLNLGLTVVSLGSRDAVAFPIAAGLRSHGHFLNGRPQCVRQEWSPTRLANWAGTLMLEGDAAAAESAIRAGQREVAEGEQMIAAGEAAMEEVRSGQEGREKIAQGREYAARGWGKIAAGEQPGVHTYRLAPDQYVAGTRAQQLAVAASEPRPLVETLSRDAAGAKLVGLRLTVLDNSTGRQLETRQLANGLYVAVDPDSLTIPKLARPLMRDGAGNIYFHDDMAAGPLEYKLRPNPATELVDGQLRVVQGSASERFVVRHASGGMPLRDPVYQDVMSKRYHFAQSNGYPVWLSAEADSLARIGLDPLLANNELTLVPVKVRNWSTDTRGDVYQMTRVFRNREMVGPTAIDLYGHVCAVRLKSDWPHVSDLSYEVFDPLQPLNRAIPVQFDGHRWITEFDWERMQLRGYNIIPLELPIIRTMIDGSIKRKDLSSGGVHGLWRDDSTGRSYFSIRNYHVRMVSEEGGYFAIDPAENRRVPFVFRRATAQDTGKDSIGRLRYPDAEVWDVGWKYSRFPRNAMNLKEFPGCDHPLFAVDTREPGVVINEGFRASEKKAVPSMLEGDDTLEVYESLIGARREVARRRETKDLDTYYVYRIDARNLRGVSLNENTLVNPRAMSSFLEQRAKGAPLRHPDYFLGREEPRVPPGMTEIDERSAGAIHVYPAHIYAHDVRLGKFNPVPQEIIH